VTLVELSTRIREARLVISEVTARTEPTASDFNDTYKDYLAGVRTLSELEERGFGPYSHFALPVLAIQSGGLVVDKLSENSRSIEHCVEDARAFYTLSFDPPNAAGPDECAFRPKFETPSEPPTPIRSSGGNVSQRVRPVVCRPQL
jgi:hypothetical protein